MTLPLLAPETPSRAARAGAGKSQTREHDTLSGMLRESPESNRLETRLMRNIVRASSKYQLIEPHDKILVAVSGGKDSHVLLHLLAKIRRRAPFPFSLIALNIDQGQPGFPKDILPNYFNAMGYDYRIVTEDTYSVVKEKISPGKTTCSLCSRLRRGILYTQATRLGASKIALGHHANDFIETLLLNLLFAGQIKAMPARLLSDDRRHIVIRPLVHCTEAEIGRYAEEKAFPIVPCSLCSAQPNQQRRRIKELIAQLSQENPHVSSSIMAALGNVRPSHLLDRELLNPLGGIDTADSDQPLHRVLPLLAKKA